MTLWANVPKNISVYLLGIETDWKEITSSYTVWWIHFFVFDAENMKKYALFQL